MTSSDEISADFLNILRCPACGSELDPHPGALVCQNTPDCGLSFPVEDGIPHLVIEEGRKPGISS